MTVVVGIIESVTVKDTSNGDCWEAELSDGTTVATFDEEIGEALEELEGQPAKLDITVSKKGKYTNRYVDSVEEADEGDVEEKKSSRKRSSSKGKSDKSSNRSSGKNDEQKEERIARAVAVHAISRVTKPGTDPDFETMEALTAFILSGETP